MALCCFIHQADGADDFKWRPGHVPPGETNGPDELDDFWQELFDAWAIPPGGDADHDGSTNLTESVAGTNPFAGTDSLRVSEIERVGAQVCVCLPAQAGKRYRLLGSDSLTAEVWTPVHLPAHHADEIVPSSSLGSLALTAPLSGTHRFFKVEVADIDTDLDGLTDWSEKRLGLDPHRRDSDNDGEPDGARMKREMGTASVISLEVPEPLAREDSTQEAVLAIVRSNSMRGVRVGFATSGAALMHTDYTLLKEDGTPLGAAGVIDLPAGKHRALIRVRALADAEMEGGETGELTLTSVSSLAGEMPGNLAQLGEETTGTFIISHSDKPTGTGLRARYYNSASPDVQSAANLGQAGVYSFTQTLQGGEVVIPYTSPQAARPPAVGEKVRLSFTTGGLVLPGMGHLSQAITSISTGSFTVAVSPPGVSLPQSASGECFFAFEDVPHPAALERIDAGINFDWGTGSPVTAASTTSGTPVGADGWSAVWETWLHPASPGSYRFRLDADDKARVLLDTGAGLQVITQHGWDSPGTAGAFVESVPITLNAPASPLQRYRLRVEMVETSGDARCRVQWQRGDAAYTDIPGREVFTHLQPMTYVYHRNPDGSSGQIQITPAGPQVAIVGSPLHLRFSQGPLNLSPEPSGPFTITGVLNGVIQVAISGGNLPPSGSGSGLVRNPENGEQGWLLSCFANTSFTAPLAHLETQPMGPATTRGGLFGNASPDSMIQPGTFSVSWSGQLQPPFSQDYTLFLDADDGVRLSLNGSPLELRTTDESLPMSSYSYAGGVGGNGQVVVNYAATALQQDAFRVGETATFDPTTGPLAITGSSTYSYNAATEVLTVSYQNQLNLRDDAFVIGDVVELDPDSGSLADLERGSYTITSVSPATRSFTVTQRPAGRRSDTGKSIKLRIPCRALVTEVTPTSYTVNLGTSRYVAGGSGSTDLRATGKTLKPWASHEKERYVTLPLIAHARYDLQVDYHQQQGAARCRFSWFCPGQGKQVVPASHLYPPPPLGTVPYLWPTAGRVLPVTAGDPFGVQGGVADTRYAFVDEAFSMTLSERRGTVISVSGLPAWLNFNPMSHVLSGTPTTADVGSKWITVTTTPLRGTASSSLLIVKVMARGSVIQPESLFIAPSHFATGWESASSNTWTSYGDPLSKLAWEGKESAGAMFTVARYGRVRGTITAPETGNYYFWVAGDKAATLSLSNDDEPSGNFERCSTTGGTGSAVSLASQWNAAGQSQKSHWLRLEAGQAYYFTVTYRHGEGDHFAIGWSKPGEATDAPSQIIPGSVLSAYTAPEADEIPPSQFLAALLPVEGIASSGYGSALLAVNESSLEATLTYHCKGLTFAASDAYGYLHQTNANHEITSLIAKVTAAEDGSEVSVSLKLTAAQLTALKAGLVCLNLPTAAHPYAGSSDGEIKGMFTPVNASHEFTVPAAATDWTANPNFADSSTSAVVRFLTQATFGPNEADISALQGLTAPSSGTAAEQTKFAAWIDAQFATLPATTHREQTILSRQTDGIVDDDFAQRIWWQTSITAADQLRQRVAFALSQILVVSAKTELEDEGEGLSHYYDTLLDNAFGNYRDILKAVTLTPAMGHYLDMFRSKRPSTAGDIPNENFARELMQLFSIGLYRQWSDGTYMLDSAGYLIPTYSQEDIEGLAHVFTGWDYGYGAEDGSDESNTGWNADPDFSRPMRSVPRSHYTGEKRSINHVIMPGLPTYDGKTLNHYEPWHGGVEKSSEAATFKALAETELDDLIDQLFYHPNVAPFICRQLIQRLVTSHPSQGYVYRVVQQFEDNGTGQRGDMQAVIKAILLDTEARSFDYPGRSTSADLEPLTYGKQREPLLRVTAAARAFRTADVAGNYAQAAGSKDIIVTLPSAVPAHIAAGGTYWLDFAATSGVSPKEGAYDVTAVSGNTFTTTARGWEHEGTGAVDTSGNAYVNSTINHQMGDDPSTGFQAYLTASGGALTSGLYTIRPHAGGAKMVSHDYAIDGVTPTASDTLHIYRLFAGIEDWKSVDLSLAQTRLTLNTSQTLKHLAEHSLAVGDTLTLKFHGQIGVHGEWVVESVTDSDTIVILGDTSHLPLNSEGEFESTFAYIYPHVAPPTGRAGTITVRASTYRLSNTDDELDQSPLSAPSVFSWYHPSYRHHGDLGATWATVPEFQRTTDTTVISQLNYFTRAFYPKLVAGSEEAKGPSPTGIAWFSDDDFFRGKGDGVSQQALTLDFSAWKGLATSPLGDGPAPTSPWTANANIPTLISHLMTLLNVRPSVDADRSGQAVNSSGLSLPELIQGHIFQSITNVTSAGVITTAQDHGYAVGDTVFIDGSTGPGSTITAVSSTDPRQFTLSPAPDLSAAYVSGIEYDDSDPNEAQQDQRLRAILHLILSSPDFIIQR